MRKRIIVKLDSDEELRALIEKTDIQIVADFVILMIERIENTFKLELNFEDLKIINASLNDFILWKNGKLKMWTARKNAINLHLVARSQKKEFKTYIFRAIGHGIATCHVKSHAFGISAYFLSAIRDFNHLNDDDNKLTLEREKHFEILNSLIEKASK